MTGDLSSDRFVRYWRSTAVSGFGTYVTVFALQALVVLSLDGRSMLVTAAVTFAVVAVGLASTSFRSVRAPT